MSDNINNIINKIKNNSKEENKKLAENLKNSLSDEQAHSLESLMSNQELIKKLLESDEAKNIIKKLGGDENGYK